MNGESGPSSLDMNAPEMDVYGTTPPSHHRAEKRASQKQSKAKYKIASRIKSKKKVVMMRRASRREQLNSKDFDSGPEMYRSSSADSYSGVDVTSKEVLRRRKRQSKASRNFDRDYKRHSSNFAVSETTAGGGDAAEKGSAASELDGIVRVRPTSLEPPVVLLSYVQIDTPQGLKSLNVQSVQSSGGSSTDHTSLQDSSPNLAMACADCPHERIQFYNIFSTLVNIGNPDRRNKSEQAATVRPHMEQALLTDLIWLEVQAWHLGLTVSECDSYMCAERARQSDILEQITNFQFSDNGMSTSLTDSLLSEQDLFLTSDVMDSTRQGIDQVDSLLSSLESLESLYPVTTAPSDTNRRPLIAVEYPLYCSESFRRQLDTLNIWRNVSVALVDVIHVLGEVLGVARKANWYWPSLSCGGFSDQSQEVNHLGQCCCQSCRKRKVRKYSSLQDRYISEPIGFETSGSFGDNARTVVKRIGQKISAETHDTRETAWLKQRLSIAIPRGNAASILSCSKHLLIENDGF